MQQGFEHQGPDGRWEAFSMKHAGIIDRAMALHAPGGFVFLPDIPFEIRWGSSAKSDKMPNAPPTGMIQVNIHTGNTRAAAVGGQKAARNENAESGEGALQGARPRGTIRTANRRFRARTRPP